MLARGFRYAILRDMRALAFLLFAVALRADERTQKLADRLAREAEAFERIAPQLIGIETLHQRAWTSSSHLKVRIGSAAAAPPPMSWQEREIISEYAFALLGQGSIHELRQVIAVNRKRVAGERKAQGDLAQLIAGNDDQRKLQALRQLQKYGFQGGATDFGQLLLLFSRANQERYEITYAREQMVSPTQVQVFHYKQLDGPKALTVFGEGRVVSTQRLTVEGEIWVREADGLPMRITLNATDLSQEQPLREEASVDYAESEFGTLLPVETNHKETRAGQVVTENQFMYAQFHRFGAAGR
jgi:hypothetical protein